MTVKVEKQLKQKGTIWQSQPSGLLKPWKPNLKTNIGGGPSHQNEEGKAEYPREKKDPQSLLKVSMLLLLLITVTLNAFIVWVLVMLLHSVQEKES